MEYLLFQQPSFLTAMLVWQFLLEILSLKILSSLGFVDSFRALTCWMGDTQRIREHIVVVLEFQTSAERLWREPAVPLVLACQLPRQP